MGVDNAAGRSNSTGSARRSTRSSAVIALSGANRASSRAVTALSGDGNEHASFTLLVSIVVLNAMQ